MTSEGMRSELKYFRAKGMGIGRYRSIEAVLLFTAFIASTYGFGVYLFPAMVESIRQEIPFSYGTMGAMSGLVQAGFMVCALMSGILTVRFGALPMMLGSIAVCALALGGLALASNIYMMAALLVVLGGSAAAIWVPMVDVSQEVVPIEHRGKALGLMSSGTSYGVFINSLLLTNLLPTSGWRSLWAATFVLVALLAIAGFIRLRGLGRRHVPGSQAGHSIRTRWSGLPKGLAAAVLVMMFLNGLSCMPYQTYLSAFLESEAGYSADTAAYVWRVIGVVGMVSGFAIGALADRITVRWGMIVTYLILASSCLLVLNATGGKASLLLYCAAITFGISFYAIFGLVPAYISHVFGAGAAALVFAFGNIALGVGGIVGNMLGGVLKESIGSFEPIYLIMLGAALCSALLSAALPSERKFRLKAQPADA
ncbi:MFS transporter [Sinorhizobium garamanticum]|uniref:MFS transporter n=1 Tax=Sinorhizobium garamanticum TaxID=680247 RepID=A0ABY8D6Q0_9HYPH|nr:MFS transporter [Sinorhizobium garamanticum]WEX85752.1 MFS transporter [Sinorhizobium garamanticum]